MAKRLGLNGRGLVTTVEQSIGAECGDIEIPRGGVADLTHRRGVGVMPRGQLCLVVNLVGLIAMGQRFDQGLFN